MKSGSARRCNVGKYLDITFLQINEKLLIGLIALSIMAEFFDLRRSQCMISSETYIALSPDVASS